MDLQLGPDHDLQVDNFDLGFTSERGTIKQRLTIKLRTYYGEWFLNRALGIPYREDILVKNPNRTVVEGILKNAILEDPDVVSLVEFSLGYDNLQRHLQLEFAAVTTYGSIYFEVNL